MWSALFVCLYWVCVCTLSLKHIARVFEVPSSVCCLTKHMYPLSLCPPHLKTQALSLPSQSFILPTLYLKLPYNSLSCHQRGYCDPSSVINTGIQNRSFNCGHQTSGPWAQEQVSSFNNRYFITDCLWREKQVHLCLPWKERSCYFLTSVQVHKTSAHSTRCSQ